jgi:enoyl-CoA hydratase/carnithine racemase
VSTLKLERSTDRRGLMTVTLDRPEKLNAINLEMHMDLQALCRDLQTDYETRVVVFTGAGRAFSGGADIGSSRAPRGSAATSTMRAQQSATDPLQERLAAGTGSRTAELLEGLDQVTIGAINGLAVGGAVVLLSCLDIRFAAESAWFAIPEVDLDIPLTWNALPRLVRELGPARTRELVLSCDRFSAQEAERWGFVNRVVPDGDVVAYARAFGERLLAKDPLSVAATKSAVASLAQLMVPGQPTYSDRELLMLTRRLRVERALKSEDASG